MFEINAIYKISGINDFKMYATDMNTRHMCFQLDFSVIPCLK